MNWEIFYGTVMTLTLSIGVGYTLKGILSPSKYIYGEDGKKLIKKILEDKE